MEEINTYAFFSFVMVLFSHEVLLKDDDQDMEDLYEFVSTVKEMCDEADEVISSELDHFNDYVILNMESILELKKDMLEEL